MRASLWWMAALCLVAAGCGGEEADQITADEVITLQACGPVQEGAEPADDPAIEGPCEPVADGVSEVSLRVCVPVETRRKDLRAALSLSAGRWRSAEASTDGLRLEVPLGEAGCGERSFITPLAVEPAVLVRAELLGYSASQWIQLVPAAIDTLTLTAEPAAFEPHAQVKLTADVQAVGAGHVSTGTQVVFEIAAVDPPDASAWLQPTRVQVAAGQAVSVLTVGGTTRSVTVRATAEPPEVEGVDVPDPVSQELVVGLKQE